MSSKRYFVVKIMYLNIFEWVKQFVKTKPYKNGFN